MSRLLIVQLVRECHAELRRFAARTLGNHSDAEDVAQEAYQQLLKRELMVGELDNPKAYLFQTAKNLAFNRIRKQQNHENYVAAASAEENDDGMPSLERAYIAESDLYRVQSVVDALPEKEQKAFILSRCHDFTYSEIAETLNIPVSTVEKCMSRALNSLRNSLYGG